MADFLERKTGTSTEIIGITPTATDFDRDAAKRENEQTEKAMAQHERNEAARRERERKALPDEGERRRACIVGLRRFVKKTTRDGDTDRAAKLIGFADNAEAALTEYDEHTKTLQSKRPDPLGDAVQAAARELRKVLKASFPSDADAVAYARMLPLIEAKAEAGRVADKYAKIARERGKADRDFWAAVTAGGRLAIGGFDDDANTRRLVEAGL